jgi:hypothetical protein
MKKLKRLIFMVLLGLTSCVGYPELYEDTNEGNFDALCHIIDTRYCYLDYKKINWDSITSVYYDSLDYVTADTGLFTLMANLLKTLKDGHVNLYSAFDISHYWDWFTDYPSNYDGSLINSSRYLGNTYRQAGGLYYQRIHTDSIGYIKYDSFSDYFSLENVLYVFDYFKNCSGLILDIRNNGGGDLANAANLASCFMQEKTLTGYIQHKTGPGHSDFSEPVATYTLSIGSHAWRKPVVVLTNRICYSASNDFVCRMKKAPYAVILGDSTGGGAGMPVSNELPNGWMVRFSANPMYDANMNNIEWGIAPDVRVSLKQSDVNKGYDTLVEKAAALINQ